MRFRYHASSVTARLEGYCVQYWIMIAPLNVRPSGNLKSHGLIRPVCLSWLRRMRSGAQCIPSSHNATECLKTSRVTDIVSLLGRDGCEG